METIIKHTPAELTKELLDRIKNFIGGSDNYEIELHLKSSDDAAFYKKLDQSIQEAKAGKVVRFTPDEFDAYTTGKLR